MKVVMGHGLVRFQQTPYALGLLYLTETSSRCEASAVSIIFSLPTLYAWVAREGDVLPMPETQLEESH